VIKASEVTGHRSLRFNSPDDVLAEVDRLVAAERAGTLRSAGNWSLGQNLGHLAAWIDYPYDGYPLKTKWIVRLFARRFLKKQFIKGPMKKGVHIPGVQGGTVGIEPLPTEEGVARYRRAWERLRKTVPPIPNPLFGPLTHQEWIALHCRHAELHLGFLHVS
jgi:hypothetical protein